MDCLTDTQIEVLCSLSLVINDSNKAAASEILTNHVELNLTGKRKPIVVCMSMQTKP